MKKFIIFLSFIFVAPTLAIGGVLCNSNATHDLEVCAENNFKSSDDQLNRAYKAFSIKLPENEKKLLVSAQREWVKYKEQTCQGAYDATYPGEEAGIDKWACLNQITKTRTNELDYLDSGVGSDSFAHALDVVSTIYENGNRESFLDRLSDQPKDRNDLHWSTYVSQNCDLASRRLHEEKKLCVARQNFYRYR